MSEGAEVRAAGPQRLRLAYVVKMFPRFSETFILNELLELERLGFEITIYSLKHPALGPRHPQLQKLRARVVLLPERPIEWLTRGPVHVARAFLERPGVVLRMLLYVMTRGTHQAWKRFFQAAVMRTDLRRNPVAWIHAHFASAPSRVAWFAARLAAVPFSFTAHAKDIYQQGTDLDLLRDKMNAAAFVVTVSDYNREYLAGISGNGARLRRLYNGVDLMYFTPARSSSSGAEVLAVGRLVEKKGFNVLLSAWSEVLRGHPEARLTLVGTGPEESRLRAQAENLGLPTESVLWAGDCTQDEVRAMMARAQLFCLPCRLAADGNRDGLPTVLLEAMGAGLPCVSTRVTGIPEIIRSGEDGLLVDPDDSVALARALDELLCDLPKCQAMGRRARARAEERFDLRRSVGQLAEWFQERA
ncbi:MAG: glycosyltransferase family 4 protein [Candidatus Eisenbacteria bacterium]